MSWLEDILASLQQGGQPGAMAAQSPFPAMPAPVDEAAEAAAAREAAGARLIRSNQRRVDPFGMPDMNGAGIQLALGQGAPGTGVPGPVGEMAPGAPDGSVFGAPNMAATQPFSIGGVPPSMALASKMASPPPMPEQAPITGLEAPIGGAPIPTPPGAPTDASAAARRPVSAPAPAPMAIAAPPPAAAEEPSFMQRMGAGMKSIAPALLSTGAALSGDMGHLATAQAAQRDALALQAEQQNLTGKALLQAGAPRELVMAAVKNPELMKAAVGQYFGKDKWKVVQTGENNGHKTFQAYNEQDGTFKDIPGQPPAGAAGEIPVLNDAQQRRVQAIIEGREPYPSPNTRSGDAQMIREAVHAADPGFDAVNYQSRQQTRLKFTKGKGADNLTSFNTTIGHLGSLDSKIDGLNNSNVPFWNEYIANPIAAQTNPKYQAARKEFEAARTAVSDELTRSFRGSGGNVHDIKQWEATINAADSPIALKSAVRAAAELLKSRIDAVGDEYNRGMGTTKDPLELLNPKSAAAFQKMLDGERAGGTAKPVAGGTVSVGGASIPWSVVH